MFIVQKHATSIFIKSTFLVVLLFSVQLIVAQKPVITSFSPAFGPVGTTVTISGSNFSATPNQNIVFFGSVKANVTAASPSSLTVTVPAGSTYQPVSVTVNQLVGFSSNSFLVTFPGGSDISANSFENAIDTSTGTSPNDVSIADFDLDGLPDMAVANNIGSNIVPSTISVFRNTHTANNKISFDAKKEYPTGGMTYAIATGDLNGDGKPEIVSASVGSSSITIFKNLSVTGNINFESGQNISLQSATFSICISDIDVDGKPDILVTSSTYSLVSVFRNTSNNGNISFSPAINFSSPYTSHYITAGDLNGDGKPDIAFTADYQNSISVLLNQSTPGSILLANRLDYYVGTPRCIKISDLNNDGKLDLIVSSYTGDLNVFRNQSSGATFSLGTIQTWGISSNYHINAQKFAIDDLNGDGKPDILLESTGVDIFQNTSYTAGYISFTLTNGLYFGPASGVAIADLDMDGKSDLAITDYTGNQITLVRNKNNEPTITSFTPTAAVPGVTVTLTGINFLNTLAVSVGGVPASFTTVDSKTLKVIIPQGVSSDIIKVTNQYGTGQIGGFQLTEPPTIKSFFPKAGGPGDTVTIVGKNFLWLTEVSFGGTAANPLIKISDTIKAIVGNGSTGYVKVTTLNGKDSVSGFTFLPYPKINNFSPTYSGPGVTVTLTGENFTGATSVSFGGVPAKSFTVNSSTEIAAVVDTGASGDVKVTTAFGTATKPNFTYYPAPTISSFSPIGGDPYDTITVYGTNLTNVQNVRIDDVLQSYIVVSPTVMKVIIGFGNYAYTDSSIKITTLGGSAIIKGFIYHPYPLITSVFPLEVCPGMPVEITGVNFFSGTTVKFGGIPARSVTINSTKSITAIVENANGDSVTTANSFGQDSYLSHGLRVVKRPLITSFTPLSGPSGTIVSITGGNFETVPDKNAVYFGNVKATVLSANQNEIKVQVPLFFKFGSITVKNDSLITETSKPFYGTFVGEDSFTTNSFSNRIQFPTRKGPTKIKIADLDADGKTDVIIAADSSLVIYRNTSINKMLSLGLPTYIPIHDHINCIEIGDIDLDGKLDIAIGTNHNQGSSNDSVYLFKNVSQIGQILFDYKRSLFSELCGEIIIKDFDNNGRNDEFLVNTMSASYFPYFKNLGNSSSWSFQKGLFTRNFSSFNSEGLLGSFSYADVKNNGAFSWIYASSDFVSVDGTKINTDGYRSFSILPFDADLDGYIDIATSRLILVNKGNLNFNKIGNPSIDFVKQLADDLNGDGKPDILNLKSSPYTFSVNKNLSVKNNIHFSNEFVYGIPQSEYVKCDVATGDLNGDGKPDIALVAQTDSTFSILLNQIGSGNVCPGGNLVLNANNIGTAYQWQVNKGGGYVNIANNQTYSGSNLQSLSIVNVPDSFNLYQYRCITDGKAGNDFILQTINSWNGSASNAWENPANWSCGSVPNTNSNVYIGGSTVVINSDVKIRSLKTTPQTNITITTGHTLTIVK